MKKVATILAVLAMIGWAQVAWASPHSDAVNALSPVGYWQFESDWTDSTAGGNTLTPFNGSALTAGPGLPGLPGNAADFRHAGGQRGAYAATGPANALDLSGGTQYSINAWVANDEVWGSWGMIAVARDVNWGGGNWYYGLSSYVYDVPDPDTTGMRAWTGGLATLEGLPIAADSGWHMQTVTVDLALAGNEVNFYMDGALYGTKSLDGTLLAGPTDYFNVGNPTNPITAAWTSNDLNGRIDDLAVFSTALSAGDAAALYAAANIPEPATLALLGTGGLLALLRRRR